MSHRWTPVAALLLALLAIVAIGCGDGSSSDAAAGRGRTRDAPPCDRPSPDSPVRVDPELFREVGESGSVDVAVALVGIGRRGQPIETVKREVAIAQDGALADLVGTGYTVRERFTVVHGLVLTVDGPALEALEESTWVVRVDEIRVEQAIV